MGNQNLFKRTCMLRQAVDMNSKEIEELKAQVAAALRKSLAPFISEVKPDFKITVTQDPDQPSLYYFSYEWPFVPSDLFVEVPPEGLINVKQEWSKCTCGAFDSRENLPHATDCPDWTEPASEKEELKDLLAVVLKPRYRHPDNPPLSEVAEKFVEKCFPCEPPCDSYGVCENCCEATVFGAGYNFGYRAAQLNVTKLLEAIQPLLTSKNTNCTVGYRNWDQLEEVVAELKKIPIYTRS